MSKQDLLAELSRLQEREAECERLINLIEDGDQDLDLSADMGTISLAVLNTISESISRRIQHVDHLIEADSNRTMDRFRKAVR